MRGSDMFTVFVFFPIVIAMAGSIFFALHLRYRRRVLQHQERMAALEKGTPLPELREEQPSHWPGRIYLLRGMMWLFSGIAIVAFLSAMSFYSLRGPSLESRLSRARNLKAMGATDEQIRQAENEPTRDAMPGGVALLGLVPIGIGLAYLIYYRVEEKRSAKV
ncbi:MAG TPA: DUF6249 domain-containing protein [Bryobacteraceae bacterium]|jgi:hypothetical protein